jgi:hypothetical protein
MDHGLWLRFFLRQLNRRRSSQMSETIKWLPAWLPKMSFWRFITDGSHASAVTLLDGFRPWLRQLYPGLFSHLLVPFRSSQIDISP